MKPYGVKCHGEYTNHRAPHGGGTCSICFALGRRVPERMIQLTDGQWVERGISKGDLKHRRFKKIARRQAKMEIKAILKGGY